MKPTAVGSYVLIVPEFGANPVTYAVCHFNRAGQFTGCSSGHET
jgi:hypothetical protein